MSQVEYIWNEGRNRKVKLSTIKEFVIRGYGQEWEVLAMMSGADHTIVFKATSKDSCIEFIDQTTKK